MTSGELPDTLTHTERSWVWVPGDGVLCDGKLTIRQRRTRGGRRLELDTYLVQEQAARVGVMGRVFLVAKQSGENAEVYETVIGPQMLCNCKAGSCKVPNCKHRDALAAVLEVLGPIAEPVTEAKRESRPTRRWRAEAEWC
jgi:hypothetical protein